MRHSVTRGEKRGGLYRTCHGVGGSLGMFHLIASFRLMEDCIDYRLEGNDTQARRVEIE